MCIRSSGVELTTGVYVRRWAFTSAIILAAAGLVAPAANASAASPYDAASQSDLHNLYNAAVSFYYYGPTGSFEGITEKGLSDQGYTRAANSRVQLWVEGTGDNFSATSEDIRGGRQFSVTASGSFNGNGGGSVGASSPQPAAAATVAAFLLVDTNAALDAAALATALAAGKVTGQKICDASVEYPGTHQSGSSVSDQTLACYAALARAGATLDSILKAMRTNGGEGMLENIALDFAGDGSRPAAAPPWVGSDQGRPTNGRSTTPSLPDFWRIPKSAPQLSGEYSAAAKQTVMTQCVQLVSIALIGDPIATCKSRPIFSSGQSDVPESTNHDIAALSQTPQWIQLHYRSAAENPSYDGWQKSQPACASTTAAQNCDEYPFFSSQEGGGQAVPAPSLKKIDKLDNQKQGSNYSSFLSVCNIYSATDKTFLAVPIPPIFDTVPTLAICNGQ